MRIPAFLLSLSLLAPALADPLPITRNVQERRPDGSGTGDKGVSVALFSSLERMSRLVDVAYCVGTSGVSKPFSCVSRCKDFASLTLVTTWNTGVLLGDSCGYIAVDHGVRRPGLGGGGAVGEKAIIVAFRGTYSLSNTVVDLASMPQEYVPYPSSEEPKHRCQNCTVHMGFLSSWRHARKEVLPWQAADDVQLSFHIANLPRDRPRWPRACYVKHRLKFSAYSADHGEPSLLVQPNQISSSLDHTNGL